MTELDNAVLELRQKLAAAGAKFLLIYTTANPITDKIDTRITSNSDKGGVRAILTYILRPTKAALGLFAQALESSARAALGASVEAIDAAKDGGAFTTAAAALFESARPQLTIVGWDEETQPSPN